VAEDGQARLLRQNNVFYVCARPSGSLRRLLPKPAHHFSIALRNFQLAGHFVAWRQDFGDPSTVESDLVLLDARSGKRKQIAAINFDFTTGALLDYVVNTRGTVVFLERFADDTMALVKATAARHSTLDSGARGELKQLALTRAGDVVYWRHAGEPRSARIP
jgi:hypothetical protein